MNENIIVSVRARPFNEKEVRDSEHCLWQFNNTTTISSLPPPTQTASVSSSTLPTPLKSSTSSSTSLKTPLKTTTTQTPIKQPISTPIKPISTPIKPVSTPIKPISTPIKQPTTVSTSTPAQLSKFIPNTYVYDHLFPPTCDNYEVYDKVAKNMIKSAMEGYNATIFGYGMTNSGKTHTIFGHKKNPGIVPLSIYEIFEYISQTKDREFLLRVSYLEIYNESVNDLIGNFPDNVNLKVHEHPVTGVFVGGLKEEIVLSVDHVMSLISMGEAHRHVGSTSFNSQSSRSHTIFKLIIESKEVDIDGNGASPSITGNVGAPVRYSTLNIIDLAGSERASDSGVNAMRNKEGAFINKSLLTLGTVISKLSENSTSHIPYRDSKLTRILQSSLSGNSRVAIICTITLASSNFEETHNTLKFASRAKKISQSAKVNEIMDDKALLKQYRNEIAELKLKLTDALSTEMELQKTQSEKEKIKLSNQELALKLVEHEKHRSLLESKINNLNKLILVSSNVTGSNSKSSGSKSTFVSQNNSPSILASATAGNGGSFTPNSFSALLQTVSNISPNPHTPLSQSLNTLTLSNGMTNGSGGKGESNELIHLQNQMVKLELELEEKNKKIEFLMSMNEDTALDKIKQLEGELVQRDMDLGLYQRQSNRQTNELSIKEEKINSLEDKLREILKRYKQLESENIDLKSKVQDYEVMY